MFGEALSESRVETQTEEDKERLEEKEGVRELRRERERKPTPLMERSWRGSGVLHSRASGREGGGGS